jgi:phosphopantetheine adenylyltransferase
MDQKLASDAKLSALVVSQETCSGANTINRLRVSKGKSKLTIIVIPRVIRADGTLESSTKLRKEEHEKI